ncbi:MAG: dynamin family protein [Acidobacteriota bacterium]
MNSPFNDAINVVSEIAERYQITTLALLINVCQKAVKENEINVAVVGRFKAGKSSFLNNLLDIPFLPVGAVPVTALITEIGYGEPEKAFVTFLNGETTEIALDLISQFINERENPHNQKQAAQVTIQSPALQKFNGVRFIDTPGLDSALTHNTQAALNWLPNVAIALIAMSIETPLSQSDLELIKRLAQYTPKVAILLTKADLLSEIEYREVVAFIREQSRSLLGYAPAIFPFSIRPGYEDFKRQLEAELLKSVATEFHHNREEIIHRKIVTLLREGQNYLALALKSAEMREAERTALSQQLLSEKDFVKDTKAAMQLIIEHAQNHTRTTVKKILHDYQARLATQLLAELKTEFPQWTKSLAASRKAFEEWLNRRLAQEIRAISNQQHHQFILLIETVRKQIIRVLQDFRNRFAERVFKLYGVHLHTQEMAMAIHPPLNPDIHIGRVFDHDWEIFSTILPMFFVTPVVRQHFIGKLPFLVEKNLSRLVFQWTENLNDCLSQLKFEAERRIDDLLGTVERLTGNQPNEASQIRCDVDRLLRLLESISRSPNAC